MKKGIAQRRKDLQRPRGPACLHRPLGLLVQTSFFTIYVNKNRGRKIWVRMPGVDTGEEALDTAVTHAVDEYSKSSTRHIRRAFVKQVTNHKELGHRHSKDLIEFVGRIPRTGFHLINKGGSNTGETTGYFEPIICTSYSVEVPLGFTPKSAEAGKTYILCS